MDRKKFGHRLQNARKEKHITGEKLAEMTNLSVTYIRQLESGVRIPSLPIFIELANALECSADYLLADSTIAAKDIIFNEITEKLSTLSPNRLSEINTVIDAMLSYMKQND